ncbi:adhesive plaque matrix protein 2-like [Watersipora subatra]|uniref:adhesive plaque matrix protein 2-like n=1 Tax=Watersipora subatra TaxID=2589382 RepID=UPI00355BC81D
MSCLHGTTTGKYVYESLLKELGKMSGICTDETPAMAEKNIGLIGLLLSSHCWDVPLAVYHYVLHQEKLAARTLRMDRVMGLVVSTVNFTQSRALNHQQFKIMFEEIEREYKDLQEKKQDISQLWRYITAFRTKLELWEQQLREENYAHFKTLSGRQQNGQCVEVNSEQYANIVEYEYRCSCNAGYTGKDCERRICYKIYCKNGGKPKLVGHVYECDCPLGYGGKQCETDYCAASPCGRQGSCVRQVGGFTCNCNDGYSGAQCMTPSCRGYDCGSGVCDIDRMTTKPYCVCPLGWSGKHCKNSPCAGAPTCVHGQHKLAPNGTSCVCECDSNEWWGTRCEKRRCDRTTCSNNGICVPTTSPSGYKCNCSPGYSGTNCATATCNNFNCGTGVCGINKVTNTHFCTCSTGWSGANCQVSPCTGAPNCVNGVHKLSPDRSQCICECNNKDWYGSLCEKKRCDSTTCNGKGTCVPTASAQGYRCDCVPGYSGTHCTTPTCAIVKKEKAL